MSTAKQPLPNILLDLDEKTKEAALILNQKDYTSEALSFIKNHSRTLNYWGDGAESLLPGESTGHHRFSFHDLVWLGIVRELRDFGVSKSNIFELKQELLTVISTNIGIEQMQHDKSSTEAMLMEAGIPAKDARELIDFLLKNKAAFAEKQETFLLLLLRTIMFSKKSIYLLLNKRGEFIPLPEEDIVNGFSSDNYFWDFFRAPHLSLHLNSLVSFFLSKDYITDQLKEAVFTKDEWKIIQTVRKEKPDSIEIKFSADGRVESMEVTKMKKVQLEARLTEIIAAGGFETITIKTQHGKPVYLKKQKKIK